MSDIPIDQEQKGKPPGICVHGPCTCDSGTEMYCSEACKAAVGADEDGSGDSVDCGCGHADCSAGKPL